MSKQNKTGEAGAEREKAETAAEETKAEETQAAPEAEPKEEQPRETEEKAGETPAEKPEETRPTADAAAMNDKYLRLCAEYDNYRKRSQKEKDAIYGEVKASTLKSFLPVYDNLVRALNQPTGDEAYKKGVEMIMAEFRKTMEKLGVTEMDCLGKTFDPAFHNAVMHVEDAEKGENEIVEVFQQGFMFGDKVIRFAMVKVAN